MIPAGRALVGCLALSLAACRVSEAKLHNLEELHDETSRHRYTAALEGDFEYVLRHKLFGAFGFKGTMLTGKAAAKVEAPADACLENLIELAEIDTDDPRVVGRQVEWFARLAVEDPWSLSRERSLTALARLGERIGAGLPRGLGSDQAPAAPEVVGERAQAVVAGMRAVLDRHGSREELERACRELAALDLDLAGGRRALRIATELAAAAGSRDPDLAPLARLVTDLEKLCIRRALALALDDQEPRVRATALASVARIGGKDAVDTVLFDRLQRDQEPAVAMAICDALAEAGPDAIEDRPGGKTRADWLAALWTLVERRRESEVRLHAMLALQKLSGAGIASLREEDWQDWWLARGKSGGASGGRAR